MTTDAPPEADGGRSAGQAGEHEEHDKRNQDQGQQARSQEVAQLRRHVSLSSGCRQPVPFAQAEATRMVIIVSPSSGRKVIWIRHSGRSAWASSTWLPSSAASDSSTA